jgi:hypothetical protein
MKHTLSSEEFERISCEVAESTKNSKYLWKIWVNNDEEKTGKTIYLLEDEKDVQETLEYLHMMATLSSTVLRGFFTEVFKVLEKPSLLNQAPLGAVQE